MNIEHRQVKEMRRLILSRGNGFPILRAKKGLSNLNKKRGGAVDDIFLKVRHMYLGLLDPANAIRGGGTGFGTNLRRLTERPLTGPGP